VEFLKRYGKRNNVEAVFHSLKAKFGSTLKSRNREAQKNEALCKVIAYNVDCLIHAMNEFGIKLDFLGEGQ
jgi:transposase